MCSFSRVTVTLLGKALSLLLRVALCSLLLFAPLGARLALCSDSTSDANTTSVYFAIVGDYGENTKGAKDTATMVKSWNPEFIISLGDNNYGNDDTLDAYIGNRYGEFILRPSGISGGGDGGGGEGAREENRFFPALGNHDYEGYDVQRYFDYFVLPGNERYYEFRRGPVHFFVLNSNKEEPDGIDANSTQALWCRQQLNASNATFKVVAFHHPPYVSEGEHSPTVEMRWPFREWGATIVLTGHEHRYERLQVDGFTYIVNGAGGQVLYRAARGARANPALQVSYDLRNGAMLAYANDSVLIMEFYASVKSRNAAHYNVIIDSFTIRAGPNVTATANPTDASSIPSRYAGDMTWSSAAAPSFAPITSGVLWCIILIVVALNALAATAISKQ